MTIYLRNTGNGFGGLTDAFNNSYAVGSQIRERNRQEKLFEERRSAQKGLADSLLSSAQGMQTQQQTAQNNAFQGTMMPSLQDGIGVIFGDQSAEEKQGLMKPILQQQQAAIPQYSNAMANSYAQFDPTEASKLIANAIRQGLDPDTASKMVGTHTASYNDAVKNRRYEHYADMYRNAATDGERLRAMANMAIINPEKMPFEQLMAANKKSTFAVNNGAQQQYYSQDALGNILTGADGKPTAMLSVDNELSPSEKASLEQRKYEFNNVPAAVKYQVDNRPVSYGGGGGRGGGGVGAGAGKIYIPGFGELTPAQVLSAYKGARGGTVTYTDENGMERTRYTQPDPIILGLLEPIINSQFRDNMGGPNYYEGMQEVTELLSMNTPPEKIISLIREDYGDLAQHILEHAGVTGGGNTSNRGQKRTINLMPNIEPGMIYGP